MDFFIGIDQHLTVLRGLLGVVTTDTIVAATALRDGGCRIPDCDRPRTIAKPTTSTSTRTAAEPTSTEASCSAPSTT